MTLALTGPADLRDQRWLDERVAAITDGIEAVLDIASNWTGGRNLARLHDGTSAQDYILSRVTHPLGRGVVVPLLTESNWSNRQIAAVAGVSEGTVRAELRSSTQLDRPPETLGADGKLRTVSPLRPRLDPTPYVYERPAAVAAPTVVVLEEAPIDDALWDALMATIDAISGLAGHDAASVAATVPERRRAATAKRLRKLGTYLGRIAWTLEGSEETP